MGNRSMKEIKDNKRDDSFAESETISSLSNQTPVPASDIATQYSIRSVQTLSDESLVDLNTLLDPEDALTSTSLNDLFEKPRIIVNTNNREHKIEPSYGEMIGAYQIIEQLGTGGMGHVYKARDNRLNRFVALKVVRKIEDPLIIKRFLREARLQAKVDHENICRIYEVGEENSTPYIAMQLIEGKNLKQAAADLSSDDKLKVIINIAEALHVAHKQGLVHRDIKPDNIMLEALPNGQFKPYLVDFGIAKEQEVMESMVLGDVLGTPHYMSPEQALGDIYFLDHRTDIYSLGATLYWLLTKKTVVEGKSISEVIVKVISEDVTTMRKIDKRISEDLDTIVMKCLEKDQAQRYNSALTLAQDLQCYLDGEPISIKSHSFGHRLYRKAIKNKLITATISIATILVIFFSTLGLYSMWSAAKQAEFAEKLAQELEKINYIHKQAQLLPIHDLTFEKRLIQEKLIVIESLMHSRGRAGIGPGNYALGRGNAILGNHQLAKDYLQRSWDSGYHKPEVAYWLGLTLGVLYQKEMINLRRIESKEEREKQQKTIEQKLKEPALFFIKQGKNIGNEYNAEYGEALIAYYDGRWPEALANAKFAFQKSPWFYEAKKLEGDIYTAMGNELADKTNFAAADLEYEKAAAAYKIAMEMGRSDENVFNGECNRRTSILFGRYLRKLANDEELKDSCDACNRAILIDPTNEMPYINIAHAYQTKAHIIQYKEDPLPTFNKAIDAMSQAIKVDAKSTNAYALIAGIYADLAEYYFTSGKDPLPYLDKAIEYAETSLKIDEKNIRAYDPLVMGHWRRSDYFDSKGQESMGELKQALEIGKKGLLINPEDSHLLGSVATCYTIMGQRQYIAGQDPHEAFNQAEQYYFRSLKIRSIDPNPYYNMATSLVNLASYEMDHGHDPSKSIEKALALCEESFKIDPEYCLNIFANAYQAKARYQILKNEDPEKSFEIAIDYFKRSIKSYPTYENTYTVLASTYLSLAQYRSSKDQDPQPLIKLAIEQFETGYKLNNNATGTFENIASSYILLAEDKILKGNDPANELRLAQENLTKRTAIVKTYATYQLQSNLSYTAAKWAIKKNLLPLNQLAEAKQAIDKSIKLNSNNYTAYLNQANIYYQEALWNKKQHLSIDRALTLAKDALTKAQSINSHDKDITDLQNKITELSKP